MKTYIPYIFCLTVGLMLAACGSGAPDPISFDLEVGNEFSYSVAELTAPTTAEVTVNLNNTGGLEHNWILVEGDKDPLTVTEEDALFGIKTDTAEPGSTTTLTFTAPDPGLYKYVCSIPGHAAGGMVGTIEITPD